MSRLPFQSLQQRSLLDLLREGETHRLRPPGTDDVLRPVLDTLESDVLSRVAGAHQQQSLTSKLVCLSEVVSVHHTTRELLNPREGGDVGHRVVTAGHDHVVETLSIKNLVFQQVLRRDGEVVCSLVVADVSDDGVELYIFPDVLRVPSALQVVKQNLSRREGGDGFTEVFLKSVVRELQTLFGTIGPEISSVLNVYF